MTCAYFVSDLHLGDASSDPKHAAFLRFLRELRQSDRTHPSILIPPTHLFLVGDIFDLWVGGHRYFQNKYSEILFELNGLLRDGVEIHYFEGNHDFHLKDFWQDNLGIHVHPDAKSFDLAGQRVRVEHGDLMNPEDRGYLFLRKFFRTSLLKRLALNLPSQAVRFVGEAASRQSRKYTAQLPVTAVEIRKMIQAHAQKMLSKEPFDLLISGHVHLFDDAKIKVQAKGLSREARSVNLGSWFDGAKAFVLTDAKAEMILLEK